MKDNELITRRNIELALLNKGQHSRRYRLGDIWELNYDEIREVLDDVDADVQPVRWIPATKRLPEEYEDIIVTYVDDEETRIIPVNYAKGTWLDCIFDTALNPIKVIAWMPLPEPYRKEGEAD